MIPINEERSKKLETSYGRIYQHLNDSVTFAIIGSEDKDTREDRYKELVDILRRYHKQGKVRSFNPVVGTYTYQDGTLGKESSFILYNVDKDVALDIASQVNQETIIWKDDDFFGLLLVPSGEEYVVFDKRTLNFSINNYARDDASFGTKMPSDSVNLHGFRFEGYISTSFVENKKIVGYHVPILFHE